MGLFQSISGVLNGTKQLPTPTAAQIDDGWGESNIPRTDHDWDTISTEFDGQNLDDLGDIGINNDPRSIALAQERWTKLFHSQVELASSNFVNEVQLSTSNEDVIWKTFVQRFNLYVTLTNNMVNELSFTININNNDVKVLIKILNDKKIKKFFINPIADNLFLVEFDEIPILNGSSQELISNPLEEVDEEDYNLFSSEETKQKFLQYSELFVKDGFATKLANNYHALVSNFDKELVRTKGSYTKLVGNKIRCVLPHNITTKEELDMLSMTVPLFDINHFYLQFYSLTPVKDGTLVKFSLEAYNLQIQRQPKSKNLPDNS